MALPRKGILIASLLVRVAIPFESLPPVAEASGTVGVFLSGLNVPVALAFSPDERIFYAERNTGQIRIIVDRAVLDTPFYTLPNTAIAGERGLLGLALDPGFPSTPYVYAYQTYNDPTDSTVYNRIVRIQAGGNVGFGMEVILRMPPLSAATIHNGGVIAFGPDGKLYAVVGENANIPLAQDPSSPMGKVLRMNPDGTAPSDNPFFGNPTWNALVYTYGHRNMFGLAWHPTTGRAYVTENGPECNDEVSVLVAGGNFGWGPSQTCSSPPPPPQNTNRDGPNPVLPIWWWDSTICPTNAAIYGGPYFVSWQGDLFMGDCNFGRLHRLDLVGPNFDAVASDSIIFTAPGVILDIEAGPDGAIWFTTATSIYRYYDTAQRPVASFVATPSATRTGVNVTFDATSSSDADGAIVSYAWDFGDAGTGTGAIVSHAYQRPGAHVVTLTVTDNESLVDTATQTMTIVNQRPRITAAEPSTVDVSLRTNQVQRFTLNASDPDGDALTFTWRIDGVVVPGNTQTLEASWSEEGIHRVNVTISDGSQQDWYEWAVTVRPGGNGPILAAVALGVVLVAAPLLLRWLRGRKRRPPTP